MDGKGRAVDLRNVDIVNKKIIKKCVLCQNASITLPAL
jgi:hypothetical protein